MDRIDSVAIFAEVAERGSFAEAGRRLNRSPAAVTRAVAELEARLGVRLLNRTTRAVQMTDAGQRFLAGARRVLADLDEIEQAASGLGTAPRGELAVTAPIVFGRRHVLPVVAEFLAHYPDVTARLMLLDRPIDLVEEGLDVAIRIGTLPDSTAVATRLGALHYVVIAAPSYLERRGSPASLDDLSHHDIVAFARMAGADHWRFGDIVVPITPRLMVTTAEAAIDAAAGGLGITRVLSYQAVDALAAGSLVQLFAEHDVTEQPVHILYPGGRHPAPKLRAFIDFAVPRLRRRLDEIARALTR